MSGIIGIFNLNNRPVEESGLKSMLAGIAHRGPDGSSFWSDKSVGLGHCMLWTTPESLEEVQPLVYIERELAITADSRIDNREELIPALALNDHQPQELTDSWLILCAYEKWGEKCVERIIGDFAFAIWDGHHQKIFCARDPMGLKPLYYHYYPNKIFVFASQIKAILSLTEVPRRINELRVAEHIAVIHEDRTITFYQDIQQLAPASTITVSSEGLRSHRYWDLDVNHTIRMHSSNAYTEALGEIFEEAVRCRLRSAFPVGSLLSGGLDSSSIVCVARKILEEQGKGCLHTFSAIFPDLARDFPKIDERQWIESVVTQGGLEPYYIHADQLDPLEALSWYEDEPLAVPNMWLDWGAFVLARKEGIRSMLSGYDGDSALSYGYGYLADLFRSFRWVTLLREARAIKERSNWRWKTILQIHLLEYLVPPLAWRTWRYLRGRKQQLFPFDPPINPEFARKVRLQERAEALLGDTAKPARTARGLHRQVLFSGPAMIGPELLDKLGATFGLEVRMPFYDRRLLEFSLALPTDQKLHDGWNRYTMRLAMEGILPPEVQWRNGKGNLSPNVRRGLIQNRNTIEEMILSNGQIMEEFVDLSALQAAYSRFIANPLGSTNADMFSILIGYSLGRWLRKVSVWS